VRRFPPPHPRWALLNESKTACRRGPRHVSGTASPYPCIERVTSPVGKEGLRERTQRNGAQRNVVILPQPYPRIREKQKAERPGTPRDNSVQVSFNRFLTADPTMRDESPWRTGTGTECCGRITCGRRCRCQTLLSLKRARSFAFTPRSGRGVTSCLIPVLVPVLAHGREFASGPIRACMTAG
jgi:hypothetical protein